MRARILILSLSFLSWPFWGNEISLVPRQKQRLSEPTPSECIELPQSYRISARHIEPGGVGYSRGYTTLEGFFGLHPYLTKHYIPFLDVRCHVFNNGEPALNAGIGVRFINQIVWGANAFYDYRKTHRSHYNQIGIGMEASGELWDFRANGYFPVGDTISPFYNSQFGNFTGNSLFVSRTKEFAMIGGNAEAGFHYGRKQNADFFIGAGPYYFGNEGKNAIGGQLRAQASYKYVEFEVNASYDPVFHAVLQGQVGFSFSFGSKKKISKRECFTCLQEKILTRRAVERVERFEIIVVDKKKYNTLATDPSTGNPYRFLFVDNTSSSNGTFESPFHTLTDAQSVSFPNDAIFVFAGDGTTTGMNSGIVLKNNQKLFGSGIAHSLATQQGTIIIPSFSASSPKLANASAAYVVQLASNNQVSGLILDGTQFALTNTVEGSSSTLRNATITYNTILTAPGGNGIKFQSNDAIGNIHISNCSILGTGSADATFGIFANLCSNGNIVILDNQFSGINDSSGLTRAIDIEPQNLVSPAALSITISGNNLTSRVSTSANVRRAPIHIANNFNGGAGVTVTAIFEDNFIDVPATLPAVAGIYVQEFGLGSFTLAFHNNFITTTGTIPGYRINNYVSNSAFMNLLFDNNNSGTLLIGKDPNNVNTFPVTIIH